MAQGMLERVVKEANAALSNTLSNKEIRPTLYGIEERARNKLFLAKDIHLRYLAFKEKHGRAYLPVSLDAFRHRTVEGWPALAIFSLDSPIFSVAANAANDFIPTRILPKLPTAIRNYFQDVQENLLQRSQEAIASSVFSESIKVTLTAEFTGLIPPEVKEQIEDAKRFFKQIFIIAEPERWSLTTRAMIPADPLVVGWDGQYLWLIAEFDTTPVEEAMLLEGPANKQK